MRASNKRKPVETIECIGEWTFEAPIGGRPADLSVAFLAHGDTENENREWELDVITAYGRSQVCLPLEVWRTVLGDLLRSSEADVLWPSESPGTSPARRVGSGSGGD